ncbi:MAG TPA: disulfide bond formation protein B [Chlamydiales bacterium]|jgi:disulfide bond formation protein DsbB|nr:disulfide bond formation protein B [Chlamydiales bacterium]
MATLQRLLNRILLFVLCGVLMGTYCYQLIKSEGSCPLCILQRLGMIGVAIGLLLNLRFGVKGEHYGLALLASIFGFSVSLRQIGLHVSPQFPSLSTSIFGYDLYAWSFLVFIGAILAIAVLLIIFVFTNDKPVYSVWNRWDKSAFGLIFLVCFANVFTTFMECALSPCPG